MRSLPLGRISAKPPLGTPHLAILLLLLAAFFMRTYQLDSQSLRGDEAATVLYSALPITELWELSRVTDPHPPLYYLMLHPWQGLVGESAWAMRFAGVTASIVAVPVLYALARCTLGSTYASLLAAALLAVNPLQIWLAQDIRSYPFFTLLGLLSSWALWQALHSRQKSVVSSQTNTPHASRFSAQPPLGTLHASPSTPWLLYILLTLACFYIHYYTAFLIAFQGLFVLLNIHKFWAQKWPWVVSQVVIGLLLIPGLQLAYNFAGEAAGGIDTIPTPAILRLAFTALLTGFTIDDTWGLWVSLLLTPIWMIGLMALLRHDFTSGSFWTLFFALPVLGVIALSIGRPFFKERFLVQAQPAFELLVAVGFLTLWRLGDSASQRVSEWRMANPEPKAPYGQGGKASGEWKTPIESSVTSAQPLLGTHQSEAPPWDAPRLPLHASVRSLPLGRFTLHASRFLASLLLILLFYTNIHTLDNYLTDPAYAKAPPWQLYHDYVSDNARPGDVMLTNFPEAAVSYYSPNQLPFYVVPVERDRSVDFRLEQTEQIAGAYQRIWFLPLLRQGFDEQGDVLNWLDRHADRVNQVFFPIYNLNLYLSPPTIDALLVSQPVTFAHGPRLRGYQVFDKEGDSRLAPITEESEPYLLMLEPEDKFTLSLYWLSNDPTDIPYTVFVHLIAADGFNRASQDNPPVWDSYPTTTWQPGEKITDKYTLTIPPGTPPGDHRLHVGWYNSATQERVPILDGNGQPTSEFVILNVIIRVE